MEPLEPQGGETNRFRSEISSVDVCGSARFCKLGDGAMPRPNKVVVGGTQ